MKLFKKIAGMCMFLALGFTSCSDEEVEVKNSLSVTPDAPIEFQAKDNKDVTLTVETDAEKWSYAAPEWITAKQDGKTLVVNVKENTADDRSGSISFTAGNADEVKINVLQHKPESVPGGEEEEEEVEEGKIAGSIANEDGTTDVKIKFENNETSTKLKVKFTFAEALKADANIAVKLDEQYVTEYNYKNNTEHEVLPATALQATQWTVAVAAGDTQAELEIDVNGAELVLKKNYLLPLKAEDVGEIDFTNISSRVNYVFTRVKTRDIKQMCIMEFNDSNPLNVLEYKLEDGSYFFDALVLFSGNMGWDAGTGTVRFNARTNEPVINSNTDALIREWQTYLKPIHDAGIKVYMGIMPHWTEAGITTLSANGCKWFAEEMAQIIKDCQMDGVFLDEEYVGNDGGSMTPEWGENPAGGEYFAYQMKKQMAAVCPWPTEVAVYTYSLGAGWNSVTDHEDGSEHTVAEYADIMVADYGGTAYPVGDQTMKNCTGASLQLNYGHSITEGQARGIKEEGYGWIMYFAFNPDPTHNLYTRYATDTFKEIARGCYDMELVEPTGYYKKIGQGQYDPTRYEY